MINKKASYVMPSWLIAMILILIVFGIVIFFLLGPYKEGLGSFWQENVIDTLGG